MPRKGKKAAAGATASRTRKRRGGRPAGAANREYQTGDAVPSRCPRCGSTKRTAYARKLERAIAGVDTLGRPYTHVVWRWTSCGDCGQHRIDRTPENRPAAAK